MRPTISVILPFHEPNQKLKESIESILNQTFENLELIFVEKNSGDGSFELVTEFAKNDKRIKFLSEETQNNIKAINKGLAEATGKYIHFMTDCDYAHPEMFERQVEFLEANPKTGLVGCRIKPIFIDESEMDNEFLDQYVNWSNRIITHEDISINRFIESPVIHQTILYRKEIFKKHGIFFDVDSPSDFEHQLRLLDQGVLMHKIPEVLFDWTFYPERISVIDSCLTDQGLFEVKSTYLNKWLKANDNFYPEVAVWGAGKSSRQRFYILHELGVHPKFFIDLRANPVKNVIQYQHTPPAGRNFIISYVSNRSAREKIRMFLVELGYTEGKDFICVA
jgi:glycosyltransferase involved in cell wall biosynthesis